MISVGLLFGLDESELANKTKISDKDLVDKQEGSYFTGLPLINSDADLGVGYGLRLYYYDNGAKEDPLFAYTPYRHKAFAQFFQTTNGWQYHWLNYDATYLFDSPFRVTADFVWEQDDKALYFGETAQSTLNDLSYNSTSYSTFDEYHSALGSNTYYNNYKLVRPFFEPVMQYDTLGGQVRLIAGVKLMHATLEAQEGTTLFETVVPETGSEGGWINSVKLGAAYDTRDLEPDPKFGQFHEATYSQVTSLLGADYNYSDLILRTRFYHSVLDDMITFGMQNIYQLQSGDVPFTQKATLGGRTTLRGYKLKRYLGSSKFQTNLESRIRFAKTRAGTQTFDFMFVPFFDFGAIYDEPSLDMSNLRYTGGAAVRVVWNQATIIYIDYGVSPEGSGMYINFTHIFQAGI
jgi:hypothetical protein